MKTVNTEVEFVSTADKIVLESLVKYATKVGGYIVNKDYSKGNNIFTCTDDVEGVVRKQLLNMMDKEQRFNITVKVLNTNGAVVYTYTFLRCVIKSVKFPVSAVIRDNEFGVEDISTEFAYDDINYNW